MKQLFPDADHIIAAYIIRNGEGYQDDSEHGASLRMLKTLKDQEVQNTAVFVVRYYGGMRLGPSRHTKIQAVVLDAIARLKSAKTQKNAASTSISSSTSP